MNKIFCPAHDLMHCPLAQRHGIQLLEVIPSPNVVGYCAIFLTGILGRPGPAVAYKALLLCQKICGGKDFSSLSPSVVKALGLSGIENTRNVI